MCVCVGHVCNSQTAARANMFGLTDFIPPEDWGPEYPLSGTVRHNVPIPTLYTADGKLNVFINTVSVFVVNHRGLTSFLSTSCVM